VAAAEEINADMLAFWNGQGGHTWVARQAHTDTTLAPVTEALLARAARRRASSQWQDDMTGTSRRVIVITRNGRTTVVTGWRAWLLGVGAMLAVWVVLGLVVFALVCVAITVGVALLLLIPALAIVALVGSLMRREP